MLLHVVSFIADAGPKYRLLFIEMAIEGGRQHRGPHCTTRQKKTQLFWLFTCFILGITSALLRLGALIAQLVASSVVTVLRGGNVRLVTTVFQGVETL